MMKRFETSVGLGFGAALAAALVYGFYTNIVVQFVVVGFGAAVLMALVIWGTFLISGWSQGRALGRQRLTFHEKRDDRQQYYLPPGAYQELPPGGDFFRYQNYIPGDVQAQAGPDSAWGEEIVG